MLSIIFFSPRYAFAAMPLRYALCRHYADTLRRPLRLLMRHYAYQAMMRYAVERCHHTPLRLLNATLLATPLFMPIRCYGYAADTPLRVSHTPPLMLFTAAPCRYADTPP